MSSLLINETLVRSLVTSQFPQWSDLPLGLVEPGGWDNRSFRLGDHMVVRLPSAAQYAVQVEKEHLWLPRLAPLLPLQIPVPVVIGKPACGYPWKWAIHRWIEGGTADRNHIADLDEFASALAGFLVALQRVDSVGGPCPGSHNFHRGGSPGYYDAETRRAISALGDTIDRQAVTDVWNMALESAWDRAPVWIHGDVSAGNLLMENGRLTAVIDFGMLGVGDPACDLAIAWTLFEAESRRAFRSALPLDRGTWARGRGWALWKAMIVAAGLSDTHSIERLQSWRIIDEVIRDAKFDA